jgi:hypothetical protein
MDDTLYIESITYTSFKAVGALAEAKSSSSLFGEVILLAQTALAFATRARH